MVSISFLIIYITFEYKELGQIFVKNFKIQYIAQPYELNLL